MKFNGQSITRALRPWHRVYPSTGDRESLWLGVMPKCGSRSVAYAIAHRYQDAETPYGKLVPSKISYELKCEEPKSGRRVAVIRNPVDRFCSLWRKQARDGHAGIAQRAVRQSITPEQLFNMCLNQDNPHYYKQGHLLRWTNETIKLDSLDAWWLVEFGEPLPCHNWSIKLPSDSRVLTKDLLSKVEDFYSDDMKLYRDAR